MIGGMNQMIKQAQQMQQKMQEIEAELQSSRYEASAGGDMVSVVVSGSMRLEQILIKHEAIDPDDPDMLSALIQSAVNAGIEKAQEARKAGMSRLTGGISIPGLSL